MAVGPLENVADALRIEPNLAKYVKRVVLMSGCIYGLAGGRPPIAEWNVRAAIDDAENGLQRRPAPHHRPARFHHTGAPQ